jgi:hypothetical protein
MFPSFAGMVRVYQYAAVTTVMPLIRFLTLCSVLGVVSAAYRYVIKCISVMVGTILYSNRLGIKVAL